MSLISRGSDPIHLLRRLQVELDHRPERSAEALEVSHVRAADLMQKGVLSVSPELPVSDFEGFLTGEDISGAPVVDARGDLLGIASKTDIVRALGTESRQLVELLPEGLTVEDIMTRDVVCVAPEDDVKRVAQCMVEGGLHRVLVVDSDGVTGIITSFDLLRLLT